MSNSNSMVAHIWANQSKPSARSNNGNFWFEGDTIYSYHTPIAKLYPTCALVTSERYSTTTSGKHLPAIHRALHCAVFYVPSIGAPGGRNNDNYNVNHAANLKHFQDEFNRAIKSWERATDFHVRHYEYTAHHTADLMAAYAQAFGLKGLAWFALYNGFEGTREAVLVKRALRDTPERVAKRERDRAKREAANEKRMLLAQEKQRELARDWIAGAVEHYRTPYGTPALLRVKGDELQTSQGATVPLAHAIRAFKFILACKRDGRTWEKNGTRIAVGHFEVDAIDASGNIKAGCHTILWDEIARIATQLNLMEIETK